MSDHSARPWRRLPHLFNTSLVIVSMSKLGRELDPSPECPRKGFSAHRKHFLLQQLYSPSQGNDCKIAMTVAAPASAGNKLEDLSGLVLKPGENPYSAFISACNDDHVRTLIGLHLSAGLELTPVPGRNPAALRRPPHQAQRTAEGQVPGPGLCRPRHRPVPAEAGAARRRAWLPRSAQLPGVLGAAADPRHPFGG